MTGNVPGHTPRVVHTQLRTGWRSTQGTRTTMQRKFNDCAKPSPDHPQITQISFLDLGNLRIAIDKSVSVLTKFFCASKIRTASIKTESQLLQAAIYYECCHSSTNIAF